MLTTQKLMSLSPEAKKEAIYKERIKCASDYKYLIETYFTVDAGGDIKNFILYPHQIDALNSYLSFQNNITMKTRQMGFTTFTSAFITAELINNSNFKCLIISRTSKEAMDFVKKVKDILDNARKMTKISNHKDSKSWLIPEYKDGYNNKTEFHLSNGSLCSSQGNSEDAGRGFAGLNLAVVDEVAFIDRKSTQRMNEIWAALGPALSTVNGKSIMISTPFGTQGWYYDTYMNASNMGFNIINAHWTMHPLFNRGMYKWIKDPKKKGGGYIKFYNKTWPDSLQDPITKQMEHIPKTKYPFVCDGKLRSPWYDYESRKLGPQKTARELDCTFVGTGGEVLPQELLQELDTISKSVNFKKIYKRGLLSNYREFIVPIEGRSYLISCDMMTGDGTDYSTLVVLDLQELRICGTLKIQVQPKYFAEVVSEIARRFNNAVICIENQGGGATALMELKEKNIPNIYYSILNKKDETIGMRKRKIGFWQTDDTRTKGGDKLEVLLIERILEIPCVMLASEFYTWIWSKSGRREHAPGKNDDLIMALQNGIYYWNYVFKRNKRRSENFKRVFTIQSDSYYDDELNRMVSFSDEFKSQEREKMDEDLVEYKVNDKERGFAFKKSPVTATKPIKKFF